MLHGNSDFQPDLGRPIKADPRMTGEAEDETLIMNI